MYVGEYLDPVSQPNSSFDSALTGICILNALRNGLFQSVWLHLHISVLLTSEQAGTLFRASMDPSLYG